MMKYVLMIVGLLVGVLVYAPEVKIDEKSPLVAASREEPGYRLVAAASGGEKPENNDKSFQDLIKVDQKSQLKNHQDKDTPQVGDDDVFHTRCGDCDKSVATGCGLTLGAIVFTVVACIVG